MHKSIASVAFQQQLLVVKLVGGKIAVANGGVVCQQVVEPQHVHADSAHAASCPEHFTVVEVHVNCGANTTNQTERKHNCHPSCVNIGADTTANHMQLHFAFGSTCSASCSSYNLECCSCMVSCYLAMKPLTMKQYASTTVTPYLPYLQDLASLHFSRCCSCMASCCVFTELAFTN